MYFSPTTIKNKSCKAVLDLSASSLNQFVPVEGDRLSSSLTFVNFREEMHVCLISSSYMGMFKRTMLREMGLLEKFEKN